MSVGITLQRKLKPKKYQSKGFTRMYGIQMYTSAKPFPGHIYKSFSGTVYWIPSFSLFLFLFFPESIRLLLWGGTRVFGFIQWLFELRRMLSRCSRTIFLYGTLYCEAEPKRYDLVYHSHQYRWKNRYLRHPVGLLCTSFPCDFHNHMMPTFRCKKWAESCSLVLNLRMVISTQ